MVSEPDDSTDLLDFLHSLPEHPTGFTLTKVTFEEVVEEINRVRSDSSTGYDQIPVKYIKLGKDHLAGPLMHIINTFGKQHASRRSRKLTNQSTKVTLDRFQFCQLYQRFING